MAATAITVAAPLVAQANTTVNATQLSIQVAPITITGTKLGAESTGAGTGLTTSNLVPTIDSTGGIVGGTAPNAAADSSFSYIVTARAADTSTTNANVGSGSFTSFGTFGDQAGSYSGGSAIAGSISASGDGTPTIVAASGPGVTATAIFSTTTNTDQGESVVRRIATSSTDQTSFTTRRQGSSYGLTGSGLTALVDGITVGNTSAGALTALVGNLSAGETQNTGSESFSRTETQLLGQASKELVASSTDVVQPGYGIVTISQGGTSAGAISGNNINVLGVSAGAAGSTSTLSVVQSYTAF